MSAKLGFWAPFVAAGVLAVAGAACGGPDDESPQSAAPSEVDATTTTTEAPAATTTTTEASPATTTTEAPAPTTTEAPPATTTTEAPAATTTPTAPTTTLPGTPIDHPFIREGSVLGVVGIAFDDTLSVHALPGPQHPVVGTLPPLAREVVASGRAQLVAPGEVYQEVTAGGLTGWVDGDHILYIAGPTDYTALAVSQLGGVPRAPSMAELGRTVVDALGPPPNAPSRVVVMVTAPTDGPSAEVTFDEFFGEEYGDDSIAGDRYRVVGRQVTEGDPPAIVYELERVDWIGLCWRGADPGGLCV